MLIYAHAINLAQYFDCHQEAEALTTQQVQDLISGTVSSAQLTAIEVKMMKVCDRVGLL